MFISALIFLSELHSYNQIWRGWLMARAPKENKWIVEERKEKKMKEKREKKKEKKEKTLQQYVRLHFITLTAKQYISIINRSHSSIILLRLVKNRLGDNVSRSQPPA